LRLNTAWLVSMKSSTFVEQRLHPHSLLGGQRRVGVAGDHGGGAGEARFASVMGRGN